MESVSNVIANNKKTEPTGGKHPLLEEFKWIDNKEKWQYDIMNNTIKYT